MNIITTNIIGINKLLWSKNSKLRKVDINAFTEDISNANKEINEMYL